MAYGRNKLGKEAREALLHGQLQEGLKMELMRSPSVSGALCLAAQNEERCLAELKKRQHYKSSSEASQGSGTHAAQQKPSLVNPQLPMGAAGDPPYLKRAKHRGSATPVRLQSTSNRIARGTVLRAKART